MNYGLSFNPEYVEYLSPYEVCANGGALVAVRYVALRLVMKYRQ